MRFTLQQETQLRHSCPGRCHSNVLHSVVKCLEKCPRPKNGCEHSCPLPCGEESQEKCHARLDKIDLALPCGHRLSSSLYFWQAQAPSSVRCFARITRTVLGYEDFEAAGAFAEQPSAVSIAAAVAAAVTSAKFYASGSVPEKTVSSASRIMASARWIVTENIPIAVIVVTAAPRRLIERAAVHRAASNAKFDAAIPGAASFATNLALHAQRQRVNRAVLIRNAPCPVSRLAIGSLALRDARSS